MDAKDFEALRQRLGDDYVSRRIEQQAEHTAFRFGVSGKQFMHFYWENFDLMPKTLGLLLKLTGLTKRAQQNTIDYLVRQNEFPIQGLPDAFQGYRILHLSDMHADGIIDGGKKLCDVLSGLEYDLCLITGDYRFETNGDYLQAVESMRPIISTVQATDGIYGILGNHDFLEMVPDLEILGLQMLLNEAIPIERDGQRLWIAGMDDAHFYETGDLSQTLSNMVKPDRARNNETSVLMVHSPEIIEDAAQAGFDLYLAGHTHGGQVCLPGGFAPITNSRSPRKYTAGPWKYGDMHGYTSYGTGSSGIPARFNCRPDVSLHTLIKA